MHSRLAIKSSHHEKRTNSLQQEQLTDESTLNSYVAKIAEELKTATRLGQTKLNRYSQFFHINENEDDDGLRFELKEKHYSELLELCGCFALFCTRTDLSANEVLDIYRAKDCVEKSFGIFKNDILDERVQVKNQWKTVSSIHWTDIA
ncbi:hypothetical protein [Anaerobiospirillum succiniciproducens]|uniref:hypothetical protein n=1 Tax=Anaerobiospirillum succiniciproducens TaxID=13335 RepID=UPI003F8CA3FA